ncbi:cytoplasmic protein NCK1-like [Clupea harengus]|uniref:Cytoplasmic protein NCK1-like n=1 Tax=Clupea harengus TaxID=7950 RepID=A0A6P8G4A4_CLUHA|nr:cytoplasmic protein NCK1-like [Clupea harengus]
MRKCEVEYEYSAMEDGELDMVEGEIIEILQKDGWSLGKHNGKVGLFPSNCIQEMSTFQETGKVMKSKVRWEYSAKEDDELDLVAGETIEILEVFDDEWYRGNYNGKVGLFPSCLVQEISPLQGKVMQGKVLHGYSAMKDEELDLVAGETIEILQMDNGIWSLGKHKGKVGLFPLFYVQEISALQDITQRALRMHYVLVFGPSVLMFTAFVLWGVIEGFLSEVVICSTLNLIRFITLFKTSLYQKKLPEKIKTIIKKPFAFEYIIVVNVLYFGKYSDTFCGM